MFIIRRVVFMLAIPLLLFFGGSAVIETFAESQLSNGMRTTLGLRERPSVQIEAFPIILRVIQGRIPRVTVEAHSVVIQGLEIAELLMDMKGVEASVDVLVRQNKFDLTVESGTGSARITEGSINAFLAREKKDAVTTLREDGLVTVVGNGVIAGTRHKFGATGTLSLGGRVLTFKPTRYTMDGQPVPKALVSVARRETSFSVEIPKLPAGIVPNEVAVKKGELSLVANFDGFILKVR
jgi:hypothetical protein